MEVGSILKKLKTIEPDAAYTARVRASLMGLQRESLASPAFRRRLLRDVIRETLQSGSALALASLALIVILGGASFFDAGNHIVLGTPLDPARITAEAQAIDIEVQLSGLEYAYEEVSPAAPTETTISGRPKVNFKEANPVLGEVANPAPASTSTSPEPESLGIDAALEFLAE